MGDSLQALIFYLYVFTRTQNWLYFVADLCLFYCISNSKTFCASLQRKMSVIAHFKSLPSLLRNSHHLQNIIKPKSSRAMSTVTTDPGITLKKSRRPVFKSYYNFKANVASSEKLRFLVKTIATFVVLFFQILNSSKLFGKFKFVAISPLKLY